MRWAGEGKLILTDREIEIALKCGQIAINPPPLLKTSLSSSALDLTLDANAVLWKAASGIEIRPGVQGFKYTNLLHLQEKLLLPQRLEPRHLLLAYTKETVDLPITSRLAARVEGKSSLARLGIGVHVTAPTIHAGFKGQIQLEMFNFGPHTITLDPGMKICQLIFEVTAGTPDAAYAGMFSGQRS